MTADLLRIPHAAQQKCTKPQMCNKASVEYNTTVHHALPQHIYSSINQIYGYDSDWNVGNTLIFRAIKTHSQAGTTQLYSRGEG